MGKRSLGPLLDMGSERDMGIYNLAGVFIIHTFQDQQEENYKICFVGSGAGICTSVDLLVWDKLPAKCTEFCTCLLIIDEKTQNQSAKSFQ